MIKCLCFLFGLCLLFTSCQWQKYEEELDPNPPVVGVDSTLDFKSSSICEGTTASNDTIYTVNGQNVEFEVFTNFSFDPQNCVWQFPDKFSVGKSANYTWDKQPLNTVTFVSVTIGTKTARHPVKIVWTMDLLPSFVHVSSSVSNTNGNFNILFAAHKHAMDWMSGNYGFNGDVVNWGPVQIINAVDTNVNVVNGIIQIAQTGAVGKYIVVRINTSRGHHKLGVGKIASTSDVLNWGYFPGPWTTSTETKMIEFDVDGTGEVFFNGAEIVAPVEPVIPGLSGDDGQNGVIRKTATDSSLMIFMNNRAVFSGLINPFVRIQAPNGVYTEKPQMAVGNASPNWGKIEIKFRDMRIPGYICIQFGSNSSLASYMSQSKYYVANQNNLQLYVASVSN